MAATIYLAKMDGEDHPSCHLAARCPRSTATPKGSMSLLPSSNGLRILRHRNFSFYLSSRVLGTLAVQMQNVAIGWQVYALTHNLFDLGLIGLAQFAPFLLLILIAGHAADRYNRRNIIALCLSAQLLCGLLLLSFTLSGLSVVWPVFAVLALFGSARAFMMPASQAVMVNMVPPEEFSQAVALSSSSFHVAVIVGPTLGGLLYLAGPKAVYLLSSSLLVAAVILMWLTKPVPQASNRQPATGTACSKACASCCHGPSCWAPFRSTCSPYCSAAPPRCCRRWRTTRCTSARPAWACCARRPASAPRCARSGWPSSRSRAGSACGCSAASRCSAPAPSCWARPAACWSR